MEQVEDPVGACDLLLKRCNKNQVMSIYSVASYSTVNEFLVNLARQRGKLKKGGIADLETVSKIVLKDWNIGKIPYYVQPPKDERLLNTTIVSKFSSEFSIDEIEKEQAEMLKGIRDASHFGGNIVSLESTNAELDVRMEDDDATVMEDEDDDEDDEDEDEDDYEDMEEDDEGDDDEAPQLIPMEEVAEFKVTKKQQKKTEKPAKRQVIAVANSELNSQSNKDLKKVRFFFFIMFYYYFPCFLRLSHSHFFRNAM